jgi:flagellar biogenesis protein FliO
MTTVINNPSSQGEVVTTDSGAGVVLGVLLAIVLIILFVVYGLPALRNSSVDTTKQPNNTYINVTTPVPVTPTPVTPK